MRTLHELRTSHAIGALLAFALVAPLGCASLRLARLPHYPAGEALPGPAGSYSLEFPSNAWVRLKYSETTTGLDWSVGRDSADAWLNVSLATDRYRNAQAVLASARDQAEALMAIGRRDERDVSVSSPSGPLPARRGVYCGTFDLEVGTASTCFVILGVVWDERAFLLVGQVREARAGVREELEALVDSLQLIEKQPAPPEHNSGSGGRE